jgi:hypothetical protein
LAFLWRAAERLVAVRESVMADKPGWHEEFRRALTSSNLLNRPAAAASNPDGWTMGAV